MGAAQHLQEELTKPLACLPQLDELREALRLHEVQAHEARRAPDQ